MYSEKYIVARQDLEVTVLVVVPIRVGSLGFCSLLRQADGRRRRSFGIFNAHVVRKCDVQCIKPIIRNLEIQGYLHSTHKQKAQT
jgi:hypothetical protein